MDIVFSDPRFDENTLEMKNVKREAMRTYMTESVYRGLLKELERYFYVNDKINLNLEI